MATLVEAIESYLRDLLRESENGIVEIQRGEIAEKFRCVPSQVSYVIDRRFTPERGYFVESKRGGGGYIRISRISLCERDGELLRSLRQRIGKWLDQNRAEALIEWLCEEQLLSPREAALVRGAICREAIAVDLPLRDALRARILWSMLASLFHETRRWRR